MEQQKKISIVISLFNEKNNLLKLFEGIEEVINNLPYQCELIFTDDGSTDGTAETIKNLALLIKGNHTVKLISLSRNFGHEAAMMAGIDHATGNVLICMDADLQHPPEKIPDMLAAFESGNDIVLMIRQKNMGSSAGAGWFSTLFYKLLKRLSSHPVRENASDFFLISARIAAILRKEYRERQRFLRGIIQMMGFPSIALTYVAPPRLSGKSNYSFLKLSALTLTAITSFSRAPLFLGIWFGFLFAALSLILGIYSLWTYFFGVTPPSGYTTIVLFMSVSFAILFFLVGIIGVYVGYLFEEQKNRPVYLIKELWSAEQTDRIN
jgi:dolichol-phosphate mannosyltransferase